MIFLNIFYQIFQRLEKIMKEMVNKEVKTEESKPVNAWENAQNALKEMKTQKNPKADLNTGFSNPYSNGVLGNGYMLSYNQQFNNGPPGNWYNQPPPSYQNR